MGSFKIYFNTGISPSDLNRNVSCWTCETCISIIDHLWSDRNVWYGPLGFKIRGFERMRCFYRIPHPLLYKK